MTDLNKERELELFNAFVEENLPELFEKHSNGNFFAKVTYDSMFGAWLGAKAQAVPENHLLIPKDKVRDLVAELELAFEDNLHLTISDLLPLQQDLKVILETSESGAEG